ncbi:MAG: G1 family glutamic endopeptidase [Streptosporangiaceae bacterium]
MHAHLTATFLAGARAALVKDLNRNHGTAWFVHKPPPSRPGVLSSVAAGSYNWAGYADDSSTNGTFTRVGGSWTVPAVTCTAEDRITSDWVGLDGFSDSTVEQDGTAAQCFEGHAVYYSWYEMYPAGTVEVGTSVAAGDRISASVKRTGSSYTLALTDSTHGANSFSRTATCATSTCLDTSAEWIAERPAYSIGIVPEAQYKTVPFSAASETAAGRTSTISGYSGTNYDITCVDATDSYDIASVSGLTGGNAFTATWRNSY